MDDEEGEGLKEIVDKVKSTTKNVFDAIFNGIRTTAPPKIKALIEQYGNNTIKEMNICRSPVQKAVTGVINFLTSNKLKENVKKLNYDDVFHLYMLVKLDNDVMIRLEKNEVVSFSKVSKVLDADCININVSDLTLGDMLTKAVEKDKNFWVYDAITNNCQNFVNNILSANGLNSATAKKFILQEADELIGKDPRLSKAAKVITDLANRFDIILQGRGFKKAMRRNK